MEYKEKEKATIYDLWKMCKYYKDCEKCPLWNYDKWYCSLRLIKFPDVDVDKINEIILKWCKEHQGKTRQDKFLEMFPNAEIDENGIAICPRRLENYLKDCCKSCSDCRKSYWLEEVEE